MLFCTARACREEMEKRRLRASAGREVLQYRHSDDGRVKARRVVTAAMPAVDKSHALRMLIPAPLLIVVKVVSDECERW